MVTKTDLFEKARSHDRLEQLNAAREHDVLPYFRTVDGEPGPVVVMEGLERITLGSNNYLGLTAHPQVKQGARDALERYGTGLTGSRFLNGTTPLHLELEAELAEWTGDEDALVFTTGYQANVGCVATLLSPEDTVIVDSGDHASILDAVMMSRARIRPFRHNRLDKLEKMLDRAAGDGGGVLVVVDGVFSMEGDLAPLPEIVELCRRHGARLMVDEAHGVGVLGPTGTGACEAFGVAEEVDLRMGTFSKSLASCGGFISGPAEVIDFLRVQSRAFMFTASAVPAAVGATLAALRVIRSDEGRDLLACVLDNARYLQRGLDELGFDVVSPTPMPDTPAGSRRQGAGGSELLAPIVPVTIGDDWQAVMFWKALYEEGVYANVALYPAVPRGGALLRTSVMATHQRDHLDRALEAFTRVRGRLAEVGAEPPPVDGSSRPPAAASPRYPGKARS